MNPNWTISKIFPTITLAIKYQKCYLSWTNRLHLFSKFTRKFLSVKLLKSTELKYQVSFLSYKILLWFLICTRDFKTHGQTQIKFSIILKMICSAYETGSSICLAWINTKNLSTILLKSLKTSQILCMMYRWRCLVSRKMPNPFTCSMLQTNPPYKQPWICFCLPRSLYLLMKCLKALIS